MGLTVSTIAAVIALLISISATYNAYLLRGGKLALSEILIALGMIILMLALVIGLFLPNPRLFDRITITDTLFVLGFVLLLGASLKLRSSLE